jgi:3-oxoacyl-[acyl-carrier-protein] synthase-1
MNQPRPAPIAPLAVRAYTASSAAGVGRAALLDAITTQRSGLVPNTDPAWPLATWVGRVAALDAPGAGPRPAGWPAELAAWDCRPTRLIWLALEADGFLAAVADARTRWGAHRIGLVLGTSASTISVSEQAYRQLDPDGGFPAALRSEALNTPHALAAFTQHALGLSGPSLTVSTACSSSAKAFASAERWLRLGLVDAVVTAGVDALCASVLYGFRSLGLMSDQPCRPFAADRCGISVGEAAGFALLERDDGVAPGSAAGLRLLGYGESNDAHHMSTPHPQGLGAELALDDALARAGLADTSTIDFVNLHGTASQRNDEVEAALVARRYLPGVHACATKGLTGHTMGAAGMVEAAICLLALEHGVLAGSPHCDAPDAAFGPVFAQQLRLAPRRGTVHHAASHSFGFGGNNCVLLFGA